MEPAINTIHHGDCISGLRQIAPGTVDLAFADPPFNIGYEYDVYDDKQNYQSYLDWTRRWMAEVCRVLKPAGTFWVAIGDEYAAEIKLLAQNDLKLACRSWVIWYYTFGVNCTKKFNRSHAHLFHFVKDQSNYTFNEDDISVRVPSARELVYADGRAHPAGRLPDDTWILRPQDLPGGFAANQATWYFPRVAGTFKERMGFHGCQMPEQLLGRIIRTCSNPGDIVLDPFAGSGTTLAVSKKIGRNWIGFEISKKYSLLAKARVEKAYEGQLLDGAPEPVVSAPRTVGKSSKIWLRSLVQRAIIEAFLTASDGWSSDRVIADPDLNERYCEECHHLGLPGEAVDWNRALMRLRKAGKLHVLVKRRRTKFPDNELDQYLFGSEIAMALMTPSSGDKLQELPKPQKTTFPRQQLDQYLFASEIAMHFLTHQATLTLDDILCDPEQARSFDEIARFFAPGFTSLHYRWAALTIRKRTRDRRKWSQSLNSKLEGRNFRGFRPLRSLELAPLNGKAGTYLTRLAADKNVYVGETLNMGQRFQLYFEANVWREFAADAEIAVIDLPNIDSNERIGLQSRHIAKYKPSLNYLKLGATNEGSSPGCLSARA